MQPTKPTTETEAEATARRLAAMKRRRENLRAALAEPDGDRKF